MTKHWITNCPHFKDEDETAENKADVDCEICLDKLADALQEGLVEDHIINRPTEVDPKNSKILSTDRIKELEEKLAKQGRSIRCADPRNRPGHPPDWVVRLASGKEVSTCAFSYESVLPFATMLKDE